MKTILSTIAFLVLQAALFAQPPSEPPPPPPPPGAKTGAQIFTIVEQMPEFPGGESELLKYLSQNITYPELARDANTQGMVFITFIINEDGSVSDAKVLKGITGPGAKECAIEALRVINSMPNWTPGKQNGKGVRVQYNLPINFKMIEKPKKKRGKKNKN